MWKQLTSTKEKSIRQLLSIDIDNVLYVLLLRKSWALIRKDYSTDEGRRKIIVAKSELAKCTVMYKMLRTFVSVDDDKRWVQSPQLGGQSYVDKLKNIKITVRNYGWYSDDAYDVENLRLYINNTKIESESDTVMTAKVFDVMRDSRENIANLELEQRRTALKQYVWDAYSE